jgi:hypothetical protein
MATIEPERDKLNLIEVIDTRGRGGIISGILNLPRTISVADGFSIEVFRREKNGERHIGSILSKNALLAGDLKNTCESMGIRNDDLLLRVSLGGKLITMSGTLPTNDQYNPGYRIVFELAVVNPRQFAIRHRGQDDPIGIALAALEGEFRLYASLRSYDRLRPDELRYRAGHTLNVGNNKDTGLDVVRVHDVAILMDPYKQKELEAKREGALTRTKVREDQQTEAVKTDFTLDQAAIKTEFARDQAARKAQYERDKLAMDQAARRKQEELDTMAAVLREGMSTQLREKLVAGFTMKEIYAEHPELFGIHAELPPNTTTGYIAPSNAPRLSPGVDPHSPGSSYNNVAYGQAEADTASPGGTSRQRVDALSVVDLGFTLLPVMLTKEQQNTAQRTEAGAFMVCAVNPGSTAAEASMNVGDIVMAINGHIVNDQHLLADALHLRDQKQQISMQVLRGEQVVTLTVDSVI